MHLTDLSDPALIALFARLGARRYLRDFIEVHITDVLDYALERRE